MPLLSVTPDPLTLTQPSARNMHLDELLTKLSEQQVLLNKQKDAINSHRHDENSGSSSSRSGSGGALTNPYATTPRSDAFGFDNSPMPDVEVLRLKQQLEMAQSKIARMDQELSQSRITKHTLEQAMGSQFDPDFDHTRDLRPQGVAARVDSWVQSTEPGVPPVNTNNANNNLAPTAGRGIWAPGPAPGAPGHGPPFVPGDPGIIGQGPPAMPANNGWTFGDPRIPPGANANMFPIGPNIRQQQPLLRVDTAGTGPYFNEPSPAEMSMRSTGQTSRPPSAFGNHLHPWTTFNTNTNPSDQNGITPPLTPLSFQSMQNGMHGGPGMPPAHSVVDPNMMHANLSGMPYMPRPVGTRLSPTAVEFQAGGFGSSGPWNMNQQV